MIHFPPMPEGGVRTEAELHPRYEDIAQDGRHFLTALMPGLGGVWRGLRKNAPDLGPTMRAGIVPILSRVVITGEDGPFSTNVPITFEGTFRLAREKDGERVLLLMWLVARAPKAATWSPSPPSTAEKSVVGRLFAEHVITRPFGKKEERKVTLSDLGELAKLVDGEHPFAGPDALVGNATFDDAEDVTFGFLHTDSNQHVNSLVYPRLAEEALVRRGVSPTALARALEVRWRKPFFAGDRAKILLRRSTEPFVCAFVPHAENALPRPSCAIALHMD